jgi:inosose dehydratase
MDRRSSRREFFQRGLAGAAALAAAPAVGRLLGQSKPERRPACIPFALGLASYTCREFGLTETLAMARRVGLDRISLKDVHLPLTASAADVAAIAGKVRESGLIPYGCGVIYMRTPAEVERAFAYAEAGGMEVIIGVPEHELLPLAEKKVRESNVKLAIHNHGPGDRRYPTPASVLDRVKRMDSRVGLCLDVGHCQRSGIDPAEAAETSGPRLLDVHLKDVTAASEEGESVEVGRGIIDIPRFLRTLAKIGYKGTAAFEYEKDGKDPLPGLAESVGYVRGVLAVF